MSTWMLHRAAAAWALAFVTISSPVVCARETIVQMEATNGAQAAFGRVPQYGGPQERAAALAALPKAEQDVRDSLKHFPAELAFALTFLGQTYYNVGRADRAQALNMEADKLIQPLREVFPSHYIDTKIRVADYLVAVNRRAEALQRLRDATNVCATAFSDVSSTKRDALLDLAFKLGALGDAKSAAHARTLANRVTAKELGGVMPGQMHYIEERRAVWRGLLDLWRKDLRENAPTAPERRAALLAMLDTDFKALPTERALGFVEMGEVELASMMFEKAADTTRAARAIVDTGPANFPDAHIGLLELEGQVYLSNLRFEDAALRFASAWKMANDLLPPQSPMRAGYTGRIATYLTNAARPGAARILLSELETSFKASDRLKTKDGVSLYMQYATVHLVEGNLDEAERFTVDAIALAKSLSYEGAIRPLPGQPASPAGHLRSNEEVSRLGRYQKVEHLRVLNRIMGDIYVARGDLDSWRRNAMSGLQELREFPGEASPDYVSQADYVMFVGNEMGFVQEARKLAQAQIELLTRNPELDRFYSQRAQLVLNPKEETETREQKIQRLSQSAEATSGSPADRARFRIFLYDELTAAGRTEEAQVALQQALAWRDQRSSPVIFDPESSVAARSAILDAFPLSMLLNRLIAARDKAPPDSAQAQTLLNEAFVTAQSLVGTSASSMAIAQLSMRNAAAGNPTLLGKIREYQVAYAELSQYERLTSEALGTIQPVEANLDALSAARKRVTALSEEIKAASSNEAITAVGPVSLDAAGAALRDGQALVLYFINRDWTASSTLPVGHVFVVTKRGTRLVPICPAQEACHDGRTHREVVQYRRLVAPPGGRGQALDNAQFNGAAGGAALGKSLYDALWLPVEQSLQSLGGKVDHVVIVPDPALEQLPFVALVEKAQDGQAQRWLVESHAVSYMPSVRAFNSVRSLGKSATMQPTLVALGDPIVKGAAAAGAPHLSRVLSAAGRSTAELEDPAALPDASIEVCNLAELVGALNADLAPGIANSAHLSLAERCQRLSATSAGRVTILTGAAANKPKLLELSSSGSLNPVGILAFATHGVTLGIDSDEPALLLSPPPAGQPTTDRFLNIPEIAGLTMNVDMVLLSACRTADAGVAGRVARQSPTLAAAFMQAGSRSVLATVSNVGSGAAAAIVNQTLRHRIAEKTSLAGALQQAMIAQIHDNKPASYWSPLILYSVD